MTKHLTAKNIARLRLLISRVVIVLFAVEYFVFEDGPVCPLDENGWVFYLGAGLVILGAFLRSWAAGVLHKNKTLTRIGPYSFFRHPLYVGSLLMAVGFGFILGSLCWWIALAIIILLVYIPTIIKEERTMFGNYGAEWKKFTRDVWYLFPLRFHYGDFKARWSLAQWAKNREYNAFFTSLAGIIVMLVWSLY